MPNASKISITQTSSSTKCKLKASKKSETKKNKSKNSNIKSLISKNNLSKNSQESPNLLPVKNLSLIFSLTTVLKDRSMTVNGTLKVNHQFT